MNFFSSRCLIIFIYVCALLLARISFADECKNLSEELDSMRKAQHQIMQSLLDNHHDFADNADTLASDLSSQRGQKASRNAIAAIKKTAQAYKVRAEKGQIIAEKLDAASADLIAKIRKCLR